MENCRRTYSSFHSLIDCDVLKLSYSYSYQPPPPRPSAAGPYAFAAAEAGGLAGGTEIVGAALGADGRYGWCTAAATDADVTVSDSPRFRSDVSVVVESCTRLCLLGSRSWALMLESARHSRCPFGFLKSYRFLILSYDGDCCSARPSSSDAGSTSDVRGGPALASGRRPSHRRRLSRAPTSRDAYLHEHRTKKSIEMTAL